MKLSEILPLRSRCSLGQDDKDRARIEKFTGYRDDKGSEDDKRITYFCCVAGYASVAGCPVDHIDQRAVVEVGAQILAEEVDTAMLSDVVVA
jgi:hypothetical protein